MALSDEIGPNFNQEQFYRLLNRDIQASYQRKCKKISGNDNAFAAAVEAKKQMKTCLTNWMETEGLDSDMGQMENDANPLLKK